MHRAVILTYLVLFAGAPLLLRAQSCDVDKDERASVRAYSTRISAVCSDMHGMGAAVTLEQALASATVTEHLQHLRLLGSFVAANGTAGPATVAIARSAAFRVGLQDVVSTLVQIRPDKQAAANSSASGTTALVAKTGASELLAFAIDAGALTRSVNGSTATVSGNLEGITSTLLGQSPICLADKCGSWWRKFTGDTNVTASFALSQQTTKTTTQTQPADGTSPPAGTGVILPGGVGRLSGITAKFTIHNPYDAHSPGFRAKWSSAISENSNQIKDKAGTVIVTMGSLETKAGFNDSFSQDLWDKAKSKLVDAAMKNDSKMLADTFATYFDEQIAHARAMDPTFDADVVAVVQASGAFQSLHQKVVDAARGNLLTALYAFSKPANQPETHDLTLVYGYSPGGTAAALLSVNAGVSLYGGTIGSDVKYGRLHFAQASAEFDRPLLAVRKSNLATFSLAGYWQYQPDPSVLSITQKDVAPGTTIDVPTQVLVGTAGSLWVAQAKVTINGLAGIKIPIGVKWANKTDLLSGDKVGAQVGISYDFSSLSGLFNPAAMNN